MELMGYKGLLPVFSQVRKGFSTASPLGFVKHKQLSDLQHASNRDIVHFQGNFPDSAVEDKLATYATTLLSNVNQGKPLGRNQKLFIEGESSLLPLIYKLVETAYKNFSSGYVKVILKEPALDALKTQYNIAETDEFEFKKSEKAIYQQAGAAFLSLGAQTYQQAGLSLQERTKTIASLQTPISKKAKGLLENVNPDELLKTCLDIRSNEPVQIIASRDHLPTVLRLVERAYQLGNRLVNVHFTERPEYDLRIPFFNHAPQKVLQTIPFGTVESLKELVDSHTVTIILKGGDPNQLKALQDKNKLNRHNAMIDKVTHDLGSIMTDERPWVLYYLPTPAGAKASGYSTYEAALQDMVKINRIGKLQDHIRQLKARQEKVNQLYQQGYRTLHFISTDKGKTTNLKITLSDNAFFEAGDQALPHGRVSYPNVPTEEVFTTPDWRKTEGTVAMTRPVSISGMLIEDIQMTFQKGVIAKDGTGTYQVRAKTPEQTAALLAFLKNKNADKLGEVSLVADSPIFHLGRVFKNSLVDENATCHIALGNGYQTSVPDALKIKDTKDRKEFFKQIGFNESSVHVDFMIGGPNVDVYFEKPGGVGRRCLIQNNAFQL